MTDTSVQETHAPTSICFGCGPANKEGLRIRSFRRDDVEHGLRMTFVSEEQHQAFPGMVNGGIIGTLLDCHGNWTAAIAIMESNKMEEPPCAWSQQTTVSNETSYTFTRGTNHHQRSYRPTSRQGSCEDGIVRGNNLCARGEGLFVAVKEGHPAYHRWS